MGAGDCRTGRLTVRLKAYPETSPLTLARLDANAEILPLRSAQDQDDIAQGMVSVMGETRRSLKLRVAPDGCGTGMGHLYGTPEGCPDTSRPPLAPLGGNA